MAIDLLKNNFSSGELSPVLQTRTDVVIYQNGAKLLENVLPQVEGGVRKRNGTMLMRSGTEAEFIRLIAFVPSAKTPYLLVLGVNKISVVNAITFNEVASVTTPYPNSEVINDLQFVYSEYTMYFTHPEYAPRVLRTDKEFSSWVFETLTFDIPPLESDPERPNANITPDGKDVGQLVTINAAVYAAWNTDSQYFTGDRVTHSSKIWEAKRDNQGVTPVEGDDWTEYSDTTVGPFTASDVGSVIGVNGGLIRITQFVNTKRVRGTVLKKLESIIQALASSWTLQRGAFSASTGYPRCVLFYKQRLVFANTSDQPNTIWFSRTGSPKNFLETTNDADAFSVAPATEKTDAINYIVQTSGGIAILTGGAEFFLRSSGALSPTSVEIDDHTFWGSFSDFKPVRVGNEILFNQRGGMRLRALSYRYEVDGLVSPDISVTSSHIPVDHGAFIGAAYQQEPNNIVWVMLEDGSLASNTLNREQEVIAWARHTMNGRVTSIESIPTYIGYDRVLVLVNRNSMVYLEEMISNEYLDSAIVREGGAGVVVNVGSELNWANSADDIQAYYTDADAFMLIKVEGFNKADGLVTLIDDDYNGKIIHLGKAINAKVDMLPPDVSQAPQSGRDYRVSVQRITASLYQTLGLIVNGNEITTTRFTDNPLAARIPVSRDIIVSEHGWRDMADFKLTIEHNYPSPFQLQSVVMKVEMNAK